MIHRATLASDHPLTNLLKAESDAIISYVAGEPRLVTISWSAFRAFLAQAEQVEANRRLLRQITNAPVGSPSSED